jgi:hypothetical protein
MKIGLFFKDGQKIKKQSLIKASNASLRQRHQRQTDGHGPQNGKSIIATNLMNKAFNIKEN